MQSLNLPSGVWDIKIRELSVIEYRNLLKVKLYESSLLKDNPELLGNEDSKSIFTIYLLELLMSKTLIDISAISDESLQSILDMHNRMNDFEDTLGEISNDDNSFKNKTPGELANELEFRYRQDKKRLSDFESSVHVLISQAGHGSGVLEYPLCFFKSALSEFLNSRSSKKESIA